MFQGLATSAFQRLLPEKWCKMLLPVWFSVADYSLLLSAEKPQVPATVRGIKRKLPRRGDKQKSGKSNPAAFLVKLHKKLLKAIDESFHFASLITRNPMFA